MKKYILVVCSLVFFLNAFTQARTATAKYQKAIQPAVEVEIPFAEKTVAKALEDKLERAGYKGKDVKGFITYKGVRLPELGPDLYDLYFKTDRKSRKEKDVTLVTMLVSSGLENFLGSESAVMTNAKSFLDSQLVMVEAYDLEMQVTEQESFFVKAEKKMADLSGEANDLEKKRKKLEEQIEENVKAQENQKREIEKQGLILTTLKSKRKQ